MFFILISFSFLLSLDKVQCKIAKQWKKYKNCFYFISLVRLNSHLISKVSLNPHVHLHFVLPGITFRIAFPRKSEIKILLSLTVICFSHFCKFSATINRASREWPIVVLTVPLPFVVDQDSTFTTGDDEQVSILYLLSGGNLPHSRSLPSSPSSSLGVMIMYLNLYKKSANWVTHS